jgi:L-iditol 2-dehydrogenase
MQALVKYAPGEGNVAIRTVREPVPGPKQVKVEVKAAGVCGSDLHILHDQIAIPVKPPIIMGHEFSGVIVELGEGVENLGLGERVTCETTASFCGHCLQCHLGHHNMCAKRQVLGYAVDGCFAHYCVVNERQVHRLPERVDWITGALTEPLACCVHAVFELTGLSPDDLVVITGPGPIGLICLQLAKVTGCYTIMGGTSKDQERLELASCLGADLTVNVEEEDITKLLNSISNHQGADVFLECAGAPPAARLGLTATRRGGKYTQVGLFTGPFPLDFNLIAYKELLVTGSLGQRRTSWQRALQLLDRGQVDLKCLVSHILPLTQWQEAFHLFEKKEGLKIVLRPGEPPLNL